MALVASLEERSDVPVFSCMDFDDAAVKKDEKMGSLTYVGLAASLAPSSRAMIWRGIGTIIAFMIEEITSLLFIGCAALSFALDSNGPSCKEIPGKPQL